MKSLFICTIVLFTNSTLIFSCEICDQMILDKYNSIWNEESNIDAKMIKMKSYIECLTIIRQNHPVFIGPS